MARPARVAVAAIRLTSGRPRQFRVMWQNILCPVRFHLPGPGGKWQTGIRIPGPSARRCGSGFQSRLRLLPDPPPSAVTGSRRAPGQSERPMRSHQRRSGSTAKAAVGVAGCGSDMADHDFFKSLH